MGKIRRYNSIAFATLLLGGLFLLISCLENDIPLPYIKIGVTDFKVEGQIGNSYIDNENNRILISLADTVNIKKAPLEVLLLNEEEATSTVAVGDSLNLSGNFKMTLSLYQDYVWTVEATQEFEYIFEVNNQMGQPEFDVRNRIAIAYVTQNTDRSKIAVRKLQLGPRNAQYSKDSLELQNFTRDQTVWVKYYDELENWSLRVYNTDQLAITDHPDVWVNVAWLKGQGKEGDEFGFEIREASSDPWTIVDPSLITVERNAFNARITGLKENTEYIYRARSDEYYGQTVSFTTREAIPLPGGSFDEWHLSGRIWFPFAEGEPQWWDTGNTGAVTLGTSNSVPTQDTADGSGQAAKLESKFIGIGAGKLAAGNLFLGEYKETVGTNGILDFGRLYTSYPTRLKGYIKYTPVAISHSSSDFSYLRGRTDSCHIYVALGDWDEPVEIRTASSNRKLFEQDDPNIIAYGEYIQGTADTGYKPIEIELEYRSTSREPKYLVIVCTASKYGDYFTGGDGSLLYVDNFSLEFDY
ncbi:MAG: PCMD domain-containing protein [Bacteroides sp.]|nr:PCMD domain-containing protein [Bacteroides sp.]